MSKYGAAVRTQSRKVEMIESLYKPLVSGGDGGIMRHDYFGIVLQSSNINKNSVKLTGKLSIAYLNHIPGNCFWTFMLQVTAKNQLRLLFSGILFLRLKLILL